jgi:two-component system OmpR family response regulator
MVQVTRILVVTDDEYLADGIVHALRDDKVAVQLVPSWQSAEHMFPDLRSQLVIIDAESEGLDERPVVDRVRLVTSIPLIVLSPSPGVEARLAGLRAGADDVLVKPFTLSELAARVSVLLRRHGHRPTTYEVGDLVLDEGGHTVERRGQSILLTAIEFELLRAFCRNRGHVLAKSQLLNMVWGFDHHNLNLVEVHVSALRRKLEAAGPRIVHTVRGVGYVLRPARRDADAPWGVGSELSTTARDQMARPSHIAVA